MQRSETLDIRSSSDIIQVRQKVRIWTQQLGFGLVDQTKIVTAASELARNTLDYGKGGTVKIEELKDENRYGICLTFEDSGSGIPDIELAMKDGYSTGSGLGLGLSGAKRLMDEFEIASDVNKGTRVTIIRWRSFNR